MQPRHPARHPARRETAEMQPRHRARHPARHPAQRSHQCNQKPPRGFSWKQGAGVEDLTGPAGARPGPGGAQACP
eukprot:12870465-Alexandrium_andersonii.AAC.1